MQMKLRVALDIPAERYVAIYAGSAKTIHAIAEGGLSVQFPGKELRKFVTHDGVKGVFDLYFDSTHKLQTIKRVNEAR